MAETNRTMTQRINAMRIFMVGRLALLSGDLDTAAAAIEWACRLDPSNTAFWQASQGVQRRRDRRQATALVYREAMEAAEQVFGHAHPLVAHIADSFVDYCGWLSNSGASRERCRRALAGVVAAGPPETPPGRGPAQTAADPAADSGSGHMSGLARYIHEMIDTLPAED